ncbi:MAG: HDOD domain-containing protein [Sporolactobacillus sp.]
MTEFLKIKETGFIVLDIYVARQPIYDRHYHAFGYELLYRKSEKNYYEGVDDTIATATLLANSVLVMNFDELIDGKRGFINFSEESLAEEFPKLFPADKIVIEILERVQITDQVIDACRTLKQGGYTLALDDFTFDEQVIHSGILNYIDIIKIEFSLNNLGQQLELMRRCSPKMVFLAEKVETQNEYNVAMAMGYRLFQGYFFSRPILVNEQDVPLLNYAVLEIMNELEKPEPDFHVLTKLFQSDVGLSYKIFRLANTVNYKASLGVRSLRQALTRVGIADLKKWMNLIMLQDLSKETNTEQIKNSLIRAKMMETMARDTERCQLANEAFIVGLFSLLDIILNKDMQDVVSTLPIAPVIKETLIGQDNDLRPLLEAVIALEEADWERLSGCLHRIGLSEKHYTAIYVEALNWQQSLN